MNNFLTATALGAIMCFSAAANADDIGADPSMVEHVLCEWACAFPDNVRSFPVIYKLDNAGNIAPTYKADVIVTDTVVIRGNGYTDNTVYFDITTHGVQSGPIGLTID